MKTLYFKTSKIHDENFICCFLVLRPSPHEYKQVLIPDIFPHIRTCFGWVFCEGTLGDWRTGKETVGYEYLFC